MPLTHEQNQKRKRCSPVPQAKFREMMFVFETGKPWHPDQIQHMAKRKHKKRKKTVPTTKVFIGLFTDTTINMVNHLNYRLSAIETASCHDILASLWVYDGREEEKDDILMVRNDNVQSHGTARADSHPPVADHCDKSQKYFNSCKEPTSKAGSRPFSIRDACARPHYDIFQGSLMAARDALKRCDIPRAFDIAMSITVNYNDDRVTLPWLDKAESLENCIDLLNGLLKIWKELLPLTDTDLRIGSGQTRTVIAESIRELCSIFAVKIHDSSHAGNMLDCESYLAFASDENSEYLVNRLIAVEYNTEDNGLQFLVRWGHPYDDPLHDEWLPLDNLAEVEALGTFLETHKYKKFSATTKFKKFAAQNPSAVPRWPPPPSLVAPAE